MSEDEPSPQERMLANYLESAIQEINVIRYLEELAVEGAAVIEEEEH